MLSVCSSLAYKVSLCFCRHATHHDCLEIANALAMNLVSEANLHSHTMHTIFLLLASEASLHNRTMGTIFNPAQQGLQ